MLICSIFVWILIPLEWDDKKIRKTYLTNSECNKELIENINYCAKIDKRRSLTQKEWSKDNCSLSEHSWIGDKIELEKIIK